MVGLTTAATAPCCAAARSCTTTGCRTTASAASARAHDAATARRPHCAGVDVPANAAADTDVWISRTYASARRYPGTGVATNASRVADAIRVAPHAAWIADGAGIAPYARRVADTAGIAAHPAGICGWIRPNAAATAQSALRADTQGPQSLRIKLSRRTDALVLLKVE